MSVYYGCFVPFCVETALCVLKYTKKNNGLHQQTALTQLSVNLIFEYRMYYMSIPHVEHMQYMLYLQLHLCILHRLQII